MNMPQSGLTEATLTERALRLLATREHSRVELRRKLLRRRASDSSKTKVQTDARADVQADLQADVQADVQADAQTDLQADLQADVQADLRADVQADLRADVQANLQARIEAQVDTVLDDLANRDLLSDVRFAEAFVRRGVDRGQGPIRIRAELRKRGVAEDIIDDTLTFPDDFWLGRARAVQAKRFGSAGNDDADTPANRSEWAKRARFLAARGFASDIIYRTVSRAP